MKAQRHEVTPARARRSSRRDEILQIAVELFVAHGYNGVSMDDIGAAVGVTGPALYHHFASKEAIVIGALVPISARMLAGGRLQVAAHPEDPRAALAALIHFHVDVAVDNPAVIALHLNELDRLPEEPRRRVRRLQRQYVEVWVETLTRLRPELPAEQARVLAHAAFGLMNSTPFIRGEVGRERRAELLRVAAMAALAG